MGPEGLSAAFVTGALAKRGVLIAGAVTAAVKTRRFDSGSGSVSRLALSYSEDARGECPPSVIAKVGEGAGYDDLLRELRFYRHLTPAWSGAGAVPRLLGAAGSVGDPRIVLLLEDLEASGAHRLDGAPTEAQIEQVIAVLADWHGRWWGGAWPGELDFGRPQPSVTRMAQAWPPPVVEANAAHAVQAIEAFVHAERATLSADELGALRKLASGWPGAMARRGASTEHLTLMHGDLHLMGNVFFPSDGGSPRIIDWSEVKPGVPAHDLAYCLASVPSEARVKRDEAMLRQYHAACAQPGYGWDLCVWDFRFSLLNNLLQSVLQGSSFWLRRSMEGVSAWNALSLLDDLAGQNP